jgi:hypothetical protein
MLVSRRRMLQTGISASTLGVLSGVAKAEGYQPNLLPLQKEVWEWQVWMAKLGPKYTGNAAHTTFVEFLASHLKEFGLEVARERYTLPRWEARRWEITVTPASGKSFKAPVTSYFPYSGQTPAAGATGELVYAGHAPSFKLDDLQGKVALIDFATNTRKFSEMYQPWGIYPADARFPSEYKPARGGVNDLTQFQKAGAVGVILAWTDVSDANAIDQYTPFSRPPQGIAGLYVGRETGVKLKSLAGTDAKATVVLEVDIYPDTPTDTLIATLPGATADEVIIVNSHTDGPNATEENGGLGILALAKYFAKIPKSERKRTIVFPLTTGHFAGPWVPSMRGIIQKYPDLIKRAVAALTVEHLGCKEWADDASLHYKPTGENEWAVAITEYASTGKILVEALQGSSDSKTAVVNPVHGGWLGEGGGLARAGVPTIGYIPQPNYLLAGPADGCIEKLSAERMHAEIEVFAKAIHKIDIMTAAELKVKS